MAYSHDYFHVWNEFNFPAHPNHDLHENLLFLDKRSQPTRSSCFNDMAHSYHGSLSAERILRYVAPGDQTGDAHIALYDHGSKYMYISNASPCKYSTRLSQESECHSFLTKVFSSADRNGTDIIPAFDRKYLRFDMTALWNQRLDNP